MRVFTGGRVALIIVIAAIALLIGWRFHVNAGQTVPESLESVQAERGLPVETVTAARGELALWRTLAGTVEGLRQSSVVSTNTLEIVAVTHAEGDWVEAGETIVLLADTAPNPMLHSLERSRALYEDAQRDVERLRNLYEEGAISRQELDKAETQLRVALADLANARDGVELKAQHAGTITSIPVQAGDMANAGDPLARVAQTDTVRVKFHAGSRQAVSLRRGQPCRWEDSVTGHVLTGEVTKLDLSADPKTHLRSGEATFVNVDGALVPGLLVSLNVRTGFADDGLVLPTTCLVTRDHAPHVFVVDGDQALLVPVTVVLRSGDLVAVQGLDEGAPVIQHGLSTVADGDRVWVTADAEVQP